MADLANVWQAAEKVVYSTTSSAVSTAKTRLEQNFDLASVRDMKATTPVISPWGAPPLAAHALMVGLVDECHLFIRPVLVGGGKPALPSHTRSELELLDDRRLSNGVVCLRYRIPTRASTATSLDGNTQRSLAIRRRSRRDRHRGAHGTSGVGGHRQARERDALRPDT